MQEKQDHCSRKITGMFIQGFARGTILALPARQPLFTG